MTLFFIFENKRLIAFENGANTCINKIRWLKNLLHKYIYKKKHFKAHIANYKDKKAQTIWFDLKLTTIIYCFYEKYT